jgi:serine kinase of HPr protein (carbohydrate metabolism regulator)
VALCGVAALMRGPSGSGKSDLALRFVTTVEGGRLVSDDQTLVRRVGEKLVARAPAPISGLVEVRGIGIVALPSEDEVPLGLLVDLVSREAVPRLPPDPATRERILDSDVPVLKLAPFEASAPIKLKLALEAAV